MNQDKLVSVAIGTYNGEKFLRQQLDSIYNQTYKNIEVIVGDDFSTDGTAKILEEYAQKYGLKYFVNEKNLGINKNYEKVFSLCNGEYIAFCDQDDIWFPEKVEKLVRAIPGYSMVCSDVKVINSQGKVISESNLQKVPYLKNNTFDFRSTIFDCHTQGCTCLAKSELVKKFPVIENDFYPDIWYGLVAFCYEGVYLINEPLLFYRLHGSNIEGNENFASLGYYIRKFARRFYNLESSVKIVWTRILTMVTKLVENKHQVAISDENRSFLNETKDFLERVINHKVNFQSVRYILKYNSMIFARERVYSRVLKTLLIIFATRIYVR